MIKTICNVCVYEKKGKFLLFRLRKREWGAGVEVNREFFKKGLIYIEFD